MKLFALTSLLLCLAFMAATTSAQAEVRDTSGQPLQRGVEYYIKPAVTDQGGSFTLVSRNEPCPLFVGQEPTSTEQGLPVTFAPFFEDENVVREGRDFKVTFAASLICVQSTTWQLSGELIGTGVDAGGYSSYFHISPGQVEGSYLIGWCPKDPCPDPCAWFRCGEVGSLLENGKRLLVWDARPALPLVFQRA